MRKRLFGRDEAGRAVEEIVLESAGAAVSILSLGCIVRDWRIDGPSGSLPVVLGFPRLEDYLHHARSHGATVGRVANRTAGASFTLDGKTYALTPNEGANHLHGGTPGLGGRIWAMEGDSASGTVELTYASPDGEEGYPGAVDFTLRFRLEGPKLVCEMEGRPDRTTPISLANHNYYNLRGGGTVKDHLMWLDAPEYTVTDAEQIPTGEIRPVEGTRFDFTEEREIGDTAIDDNLVLRRDRDLSKPAARVFCPRTDARLTLVTAQPGIQVFDAPRMTIDVPGNDGARYGPFAGLCLEAQHFPDSLHHAGFPSILCSPDKPYYQRLEVEIRRG
ncbi:MAG TPA: aldose epimerase family protein [Amaricoccus sp.]|nr:aldose epimerase family protein [Amaricoccus sp.]